MNPISKKRYSAHSCVVGVHQDILDLSGHNLTPPDGSPYLSKATLPMLKPEKKMQYGTAINTKEGRSEYKQQHMDVFMS